MSFNDDKDVIQDIVTPDTADIPDTAEPEEKYITETVRIFDIDADYMKVLNYSIVQSGIPAIRTIRVSSHTETVKRKVKEMADALHDTASDESEEEPLTDTRTKLIIRSDPEFARTYEEYIDESYIESLLSGESVEFNKISLSLRAPFLYRMTERIEGTFKVEIVKCSEIMARGEFSVGLLAKDQWNAQDSPLKLLASFVTPNHPYVEKIIVNANAILKSWSQNYSFCGYQRGAPDDVRRQVAAIYGAIQRENISYCLPPASFETTGQRIRTADTIQSSHLATCLDISLLFASAIELIGLHPLVIMTKGHAFAGYFLENETFLDPIEDEASQILSRISPSNRKIMLFECTYPLIHPTPLSITDYTSAEKCAEDEINPQSFLYALDICASRAALVRPLPYMKECDDADFSGEETDYTPSEPELLEIISGINEPAKEYTKQQIWERKLLDLSMRNRLLNFRQGKNSVKLVVSDSAMLEDSLADGAEFHIVKKPDEDGLSKEALISLAQSNLKSKKLYSYLEEHTLDAALKSIYRTARAGLEESGANTLFLTLGMLEWYETEKSTKPVYSPLILLPIEMSRKISQKGYAIKLRDEDARFNITLLEFLKADHALEINGLDPLPEDESGINVKAILTHIKKSVAGKARWRVLEEAYVGIFSFSQFIMWNDIRNRIDDLSKNKIVASLMSGSADFLTEDDMISPVDLDKINPADMAIPISADSSQLAAIYAAGQGKTFVLHGPPGTGKSQTITNMIANALYSGKTVLFIAEKMAALSVVQNRLEKIGLGPFCLELHSNKTSKRAVLDHLSKTLETARIANPADFHDKAERLYASRTELNDIMSSLHEVRAGGKSLYDLVVIFEQYKDCPSVKLDVSELLSEKSEEEMTKRMFEDMLEACEKLSSAFSATGYGVSLSKLRALSGIGLKDYSRITKAKIDENLSLFIGKTDALMKAVAKLSHHLDFVLPKSQSATKALIDFYNLLALYRDKDITVSSGLITYRSLDTLDKVIDNLRDSNEKCVEKKNEILKVFDESIFDYDYKKAILKYKSAQSESFFKRTAEMSALMKETKIYFKDPKQADKKTILSYLLMISDYETENAFYVDSASRYTEILGDAILDEKCDFDAVSACCKIAKAACAYIDSAATENTDTPFNVYDEKERFENTLSGSVYDIYSANSKEFEALKVCFSDYNIALSALLECSCSENVKLFGSLSYSEIKEKAISVKENLDGLKDYCSWMSVREEAVLLNLSALVKAIENGKVSQSEIKGTFLRSAAEALISIIFENDKRLAGFNGVMFDQKIRYFSSLSDTFEDLTRKELIARLSSKLPTPSKGAQGSEVGILQRTIRSGGRMLPLRKLFGSIPNLLPRVAPCMLMSPISAAQYIDAACPGYDIVIFDEASQMPTCEAVGAIARGKSLVVVGDPKQMPPTDFFNVSKTDEDNIEKEDLESILEDCLSLSLPEIHLLWHYRSKHESLIAFSNYKYYEGNLFTFPSPDNLVCKVTHVQVDGFYDRGGTKQNYAEAKAIVDEVERRLMDEELRKFSIGIVTFSVVQQHLIEDMLEKRYAENPKLESYALSQSEGLFIKNLENVQGDERDVILFSVCYAKDKSGIVSLNFGPLNREGGWRRLNVAVSRSRYEMIVFSSLRPEEIDLSRTTSEGVAGLKAFLEFSIGGIDLLQKPKSARKTDVDGISEVIANALERAGYKCEINVGSSRYRINVGVFDPDNENEYLLGILCDGMAYMSAGNAKDRNILRDSVLKNLGWNVYRIYTLDWFDNSDGELGKLLMALASIKEEREKALAEKKAKEAEKVKNAIDNIADSEPLDSIYESSDELDGTTESSKTEIIIDDATDDTADDYSDSDHISRPDSVFSSAEASDTDASPAKKPAQEKAHTTPYSDVTVNSLFMNDNAALSFTYKATYIPKVKNYPMSQSDFAKESNFAKIKKSVGCILANEAPICRKLVLERIYSAYGIERTSSQCEKTVDSALAGSGAVSVKVGGNIFYWKADQDVLTYDKLRLPSGAGYIRSIEEIPPEELAVAVRYVLKREISMEPFALLKEVATLMGCNRCTEKVQELIKRGVVVAKRRKYIQQKNGMFVIGE